MTTASIDIAQMSSRVSAMETASSTVGQGKTSMAGVLEGVDLDTRSSRSSPRSSPM